MTKTKALFREVIGLSSDDGKIIDFMEFKERRDRQEEFSSNNIDTVETGFQGRLDLTTEEAEMIIYCLRLGREYFQFELEVTEFPNVNTHAQKDFETANELIDSIQFEVLKLHLDNNFIISLSVTELAFILDCLEMICNAVKHGIDVFQVEEKDKEHYLRWLEDTYTYLSEVYEMWRLL